MTNNSKSLIEAADSVFDRAGVIVLSTRGWRELDYCKHRTSGLADGGRLPKLADRQGSACGSRVRSHSELPRLEMLHYKRKPPQIQGGGESDSKGLRREEVTE